MCLSSLVLRKSLANSATIGLPQDFQSGVQSAGEPSPSSKTPSKDSRVKLPARSRRVSKAPGTVSPYSFPSKKSAPHTPNVPNTGGAEEAAITPPESAERPETPECRPKGAFTFKSFRGTSFAETFAGVKPGLFGGSTSAEGKPGFFGMWHKAQQSEHSQSFFAESRGKKRKDVSDSELEDLVSSFGTFGLHPENRNTPNKNTRARPSHATDRKHPKSRATPNKNRRARSSHAIDYEEFQQASDTQTHRYHIYRTGQPREIFVEDELDVDDGEWMPQHYTSGSCSSEEISDLSDDGADENSTSRSCSSGGISDLSDDGTDENSTSRSCSSEDTSDLSVNGSNGSSENGSDRTHEDGDTVCSEPNSRMDSGGDANADPGSGDKAEVNHPKNSHDANSTLLRSHPSSGDDVGNGKDALGGESHFDRSANSDTTDSTSHHSGEGLEGDLKREWERLALSNMPGSEIASWACFPALLDAQSCKQLANSCTQLYLYLTHSGSVRFRDTCGEDLIAGLSLGGWGPMSVQEFCENATATLFGIRLLREHGDRTRLQRICTLLMKAMPASQCVEAMLYAGFDEHGEAWAAMKRVAFWQINAGAQCSRELPSMSWEEGT